MATAVIYARLSDSRGEEHGIERQVREANAHAERLGVDVVETLVDNDISAATKKHRPAFERLMEGIAADDWDVVIVRSLDRWVRRPAELERIIEVVEKSKVKVEAIHGHVDLKNRSGKLLARMMTNVAIDEADAIRERILDWHADKAARGLKVGRPGFGYRRVDGKTVIHDDEAALIRDAAARVLAGEPLTRIATEAWSAKQVRRTLIAPRTAGLLDRKGQVSEGTWEPILDRITWERVRAVLTRPERRSSVRTEARLLTGLLSCGKCGAGLNSAPWKGVERYACLKCWGVTIRLAPVEKHVVDRLFALVDENPRAVAAEQGKAVADQAEIAAQIRRVDDLVEQLGDQLLAGEITMEEFKRLRAGFGEQKKALQKQLVVPEVKPWAGDRAGLAAAWDGMPTKEQRRILRSWFADLKVVPRKSMDSPPKFDPDRVQITPR